MDLIAELKPYEKELNLYQTRKALPQADVKDRLIGVYQKLQKIKPTIGPEKVPGGCGSCVNDMMKALVNNRREWINQPLTDFKGIKDAPKADVVTKKVTEKTPEQLEMLKLKPYEMKFPALKIACAKYKIPFTPSTGKAELATKLHDYIEKNK